MGQRSNLTTAAGVLAGAVLGLALGAGAYTALEPVLESADGIVRELQGFAWNLVPFGTVGGGVLGWIAVQRRGRDGRA